MSTTQTSFRSYISVVFIVLILLLLFVWHKSAPSSLQTAPSLQQQLQISQTVVNNKIISNSNNSSVDDKPNNIIGANRKNIQRRNIQDDIFSNSFIGKKFRVFAMNIERSSSSSVSSSVPKVNYNLMFKCLKTATTKNGLTFYSNFLATTRDDAASFDIEDEDTRYEKIVLKNWYQIQRILENFNNNNLNSHSVARAGGGSGGGGRSRIVKHKNNNIATFLEFATCLRGGGGPVSGAGFPSQFSSSLSSASISTSTFAFAPVILAASKSKQRELAEMQKQLATEQMEVMMLPSSFSSLFSSSSTAASSSRTVALEVAALKHPLFFPLYRGVSPRRVVLHAFRVAKYLRVPGAILSSAADAASTVSLKLPVTAEKTPSTAVSLTTMSTLEARLVQKYIKNVTVRHEKNDDGGDGDHDAEVKRQKPFVLVDLAGGNGALLSSMCPPHPLLWCFAFDRSPLLVAHGRRFYSHISFDTFISETASSDQQQERRESSSSSSSATSSRTPIPTATADAVVSNGAVSLLSPSQVCLHVEEALRLLKPGVGVATFLMLSATKWSGRFHPSFFVDVDFSNEKNMEEIFIVDETDKNINKNSDDSNFKIHDQRRETRDDADKSKITSDKILSQCFVSYFASVSSSPTTTVLTKGLGNFVSSIEIIAADDHLQIYVPTWLRRNVARISDWQGVFGVRIFRNEQLFPPSSYSSFVSPSASLAAPAGLVSDCLADSASFRRCRKVARTDVAFAAKCFKPAGEAEKAAKINSETNDDKKNSDKSGCPKLFAKADEIRKQQLYFFETAPPSSSLSMDKKSLAERMYRAREKKNRFKDMGQVGFDTPIDAPHFKKRSTHGDLHRQRELQKQQVDEDKRRGYYRGY